MFRRKKKAGLKKIKRQGLRKQVSMKWYDNVLAANAGFESIFPETKIREHETIVSNALEQKKISWGKITNSLTYLRIVLGAYERFVASIKKVARSQKRFGKEEEAADLAHIMHVYETRIGRIKPIAGAALKKKK